MKKLYAELDNKGSYITENWSKTRYKETLAISNQDDSKMANLKLLVFQNEEVFDSYHKWISGKFFYREKSLSVFPFFGQKNFISKIFLAILANDFDHITEENKNLISEKLNKIAKLLKSNCDHEKIIQEIWKELKM